jgi:hypothetical protein
VGERGVGLSGGERQRIALARAFLKDAPILILDEPTSSVDARTEARILEAMERLMLGRTVIVIAHRASTLAACEARLALEHGRVIASASPARTRDPVDHPVVAAWRAIAPEAMRVARVDRLRATAKVDVYRLALENGTASVIAKRGRSDALRVEQTVYESVLPWLPARALRCFGFVRDTDEERAWLFIEDAGDAPCVFPRHRSLLARWLGTLHGAAAAFTVPLPDRGPAHYLEHLRGARATILDNLDNPSLRRDDRHTLRRLLATCERIESNWIVVEEICDGLPRTLVHGDLVAKNLRLRRYDTGPGIVAFGWGWSGRGVAAADFHFLARHAKVKDVETYRAAMSVYTRALDEDELRMLARVGHGFRLLSSADWVSPHLRYPWPEVGMKKLRSYEQPLGAWGVALERGFSGAGTRRMLSDPACLA